MNLSVNATQAPIRIVGGCEGGGYTFSYGTEENALQKIQEGGNADCTASIGVAVNSDGTVTDSWPGTAAYEGGLGLGSIDYHGGSRFPHFVRVAGKPDLISAIAAPKLK